MPAVSGGAVEKATVPTSLSRSFAWVEETGNWKVARTRRQECRRYGRGVAQTFLFAGSRNFPVPCSVFLMPAVSGGAVEKATVPTSLSRGFAWVEETGNWKVARTRRQKCRRYETRLAPNRSARLGTAAAPSRPRDLAPNFDVEC
jgi:hypothetical protein